LELCAIEQLRKETAAINSFASAADFASDASEANDMMTIGGKQIKETQKGPNSGNEE
jgi:hypothetical protein